jgi:hypothetical protein
MPQVLQYRIPQSGVPLGMLQRRCLELNLTGRRAFVRLPLALPSGLLTPFNLLLRSLLSRKVTTAQTVLILLEESMRAGPTPLARFFYNTRPTWLNDRSDAAHVPVRSRLQAFADRQLPAVAHARGDRAGRQRCFPERFGAPARGPGRDQPVRSLPRQSGRLDDTGESDLRNSLARVVATGKPDTLPAQRYPIRVQLPNGEVIFEERFWDAVSTPIFCENGEVLCISHTTSDVTERVRAVAAIRESEAGSGR